MSKNRGQSQKRAVSRALKSREKGITTDGKVLMKLPRIAVEWSDTLGKLMIFKRPSCGNNRAKTKYRKRYQRPFHQLVGTV